ncbi:MAG: hypothetical protein AB9903_01800 [Vulcanimicrobiota bacterium]
MSESFFRTSRIILVILAILSVSVPAEADQEGSGLIAQFDNVRHVSQVYYVGIHYSDKVMVTQYVDMPTDIEKIGIAGIVIHPSAKTAAYKYIGEFLGGFPLEIDIYLTPDETGYVGIFKVMRLGKSYELNKNLIYLGYATCSSDARFTDYRQFETKAKQRKVGIWNTGAPVWIMPKFVTEGKTPRAPFSSDRSEIHAQYGRPDNTFRTYTGGYRDYGYRRDYSSGNFYIFDYYYSKSLVFIYRNGKLMEKRNSY